MGFHILVEILWNVAINLGVKSPLLSPSYPILRHISNFRDVEPIELDPFEVGLISQHAFPPHGEVMCQIV